MQGGPPQMPRTPPTPTPPREEGLFGPGGRRFVTWLLVIAALAGIGILLLNVDLDELVDEIERATEQTTTEEPADEPEGSGGGGAESGHPARLLGPAGRWPAAGGAAPDPRGAEAPRVHRRVGRRPGEDQRVPGALPALAASSASSRLQK